MNLEVPVLDPDLESDFQALGDSETGFGYCKMLDHNTSILHHFRNFKILNFPPKQASLPLSPCD